MSRLSLVCATLLVACSGGDPVIGSAPPIPTVAGDHPACGENTLQLAYDFQPEASKSFAYLPFVVPTGTQRVELAYRWSDRSALPGNPITATTVDLGLWDERGLREGFRGWGGSRQGRLDQEATPVFVEELAADRGFEPGPIHAGLWHVELGLAATSDAGATVEVQVRCLKIAQGLPRQTDTGLNPHHVAKPDAGWYAADFHIHGYHSNPNAPDYAGVVEQARAANLDILLISEYVTNRHHLELAATQADHPDLLLWPSREVITYFGHANIHGEVPGVPEYRQGYADISLGNIQQQAKQAGALFQINHPTTFPPPLFSNLCRGCAFELDDEISFADVDLIEVVNGPAIVTGGEVGLPLPGETENPFIATAIDYWLDQLIAGHKITAVSGSDSKGVDEPQERARKGYGSSATQIFAPELSRPAIQSALQRGHAYIQVRGALDSPRADLKVVADDGAQGSFGAEIDAASATLTITLAGATGQILTLFNGKIPTLSVPVSSDPFVFEQTVLANPLAPSPLGDIWRFELRDERSRTLIANPFFLRN